MYYCVFFTCDAFPFFRLLSSFGCLVRMRRSALANRKGEEASVFSRNHEFISDSTCLAIDFVFVKKKKARRGLYYFFSIFSLCK